MMQKYQDLNPVQVVSESNGKLNRYMMRLHKTSESAFLLKYDRQRIMFSMANNTGRLLIRGVVSEKEYKNGDEILEEYQGIIDSLLEGSETVFSFYKTLDILSPSFEIEKLYHKHKFSGAETTIEFSQKYEPNQITKITSETKAGTEVYEVEPSARTLNPASHTQTQAREGLMPELAQYLPLVRKPKNQTKT